jgi:riboflavin kinase/FMN adenylyltransferase
MQLCRTLSEFQYVAGDVAFAAGFFDGVHLGHQRVIRSAQRCGAAWALTFAQHPSELLTPEAPQKLLTPLDVRLELLSATGLAGCLLLDFTPQLATMSPRKFVASLGKNIRSFHCGETWRFGCCGEGTPGLLRELNFQVETVPSALWRGEPISSTRIRDAVRGGELEVATRMLGRPYFIREKIVAGRAVGRKLGVPTLNILPRADVLPPLGVYAVRARFKGERAWRDGMANFGFRPTFSDTPETPVLEVHLFSAPGRETNGLTLDVAFVARLRGERAFESKEALVAQLRKDHLDAEKMLA